MLVNMTRKTQIAKGFNVETCKLDTDFIWNLDTKQTFDEVLFDVLMAHLKAGWTIDQDFNNYEAYEYLMSNVKEGHRLFCEYHLI